MSVLKVATVSQLMDEIAPRYLAEDGDNVGLLIGEGSKKVERIMICLDLSEWVVSEAIEKNIDMVICHHPIIYKGIKRITADDATGRKILKLIKHNISVYASHTNYDSVSGGVNDLIMERLGITDSEILAPSSQEVFYKLIVFVPNEHMGTVSKAIFEAGAGEIGRYSNCSFSSEGIGTFKPEEGTNPFIGGVGVLESVNETRFETIVPQQNLSRVIKSMLKAHPYEEVAYDIFKLENKLSKQGLGRIGKLESPTSLMFFAESVKHSLELDHVKVIGDNSKEIKTIAVLGGSGASYWQKAKAKGADVLITGDVGHHTMIDAIEGGMSIIDAGHFGSEKVMIESLCKRLNELIINNGYSDIDIQISKSNTDCFVIL